MGKGGGKGHTPVEAKDNLKSTQMMSVIDALSLLHISEPTRRNPILLATFCWTK
ncbi:hypothetical protein, partial [Escherichia coli]|uniref:hypothetical protein n=1 Tax=Escherichia coli TaxID=562 RepID=UPI003F4B1603